MTENTPTVFSYKWSKTPQESNLLGMALNYSVSRLQILSYGGVLSRSLITIMATQNWSGSTC